MVVRTLVSFLLVLIVVSCAGPPPPQKPLDMDAALSEAVRKSDVGEVRRLIAAGATPNPSRPAGPGTGNFQTPLAIATLNGNLEATQALLDAGADPNAREYGLTIGRTALMIASGLGRVDLVTLLLTRGADVNLRGGEFQVNGRISSNADALFDAVASGHTEAVRTLLLWGARSDRAHLFSAISRGRDDLAWLLLVADADPRWILSRGRSALEEAERLPPETRGPMVATIRSFLAHDPPIGK